MTPQKPASLPKLCHFFLELLPPSRIVLTKTPAHPISSLFPDHHSLYLQPLIPTNRAPCLLHHTSYRQYISLFSFITAHKLPYLYHKNFKRSNFKILLQIYVVQRFFATPTHLRAAGTGGQFSTNFRMKKVFGTLSFTESIPLLTNNLSFWT